MKKRFLCMLFAVMLALTCGPRAYAQRRIPIRQSTALSKPITRSPNPLASAMLLVLAGVGISLLFDKKK